MEHGARCNVGFDDIRGTVLGRAGALRVRHAMMVRGFSCLGSGSHCCVVIHCVDYQCPYGDGNGDASVEISFLFGVPEYGD